MFSVTPVIDLKKSFTEEAEQLYNYFFTQKHHFSLQIMLIIKKKNVMEKVWNIFGMEKKCWFDYRNSTIDLALNAREQWIWRELEKTSHGLKHQLMVGKTGTQVPKTRQTKLSSGQIN